MSTWQPHFADIRVNAPYLHYIFHCLEIDKLKFPEAFYMGGDFENQRWIHHNRLWINPPWKFVMAATIKLLFDTPGEYIFVGPSYLTQWTTIMTLISKDYLEPPRTLHTGYFPTILQQRVTARLTIPYVEYASFSWLWCENFGHFSTRT